MCRCLISNVKCYDLSGTLITPETWPFLYCRCLYLVTIFSALSLFWLILKSETTCVNIVIYKTCVINDPLDQTHSEICFDTDGRTNGQHLPKQWLLPAVNVGRPRGSIKLPTLTVMYFDLVDNFFAVLVNLVKLNEDQLEVFLETCFKHGEF